MKSCVSKAVLGTALVGLALLGVAGSSQAAEIFVISDISTSTTWTANNTYNLQQQIYVLPGATLTIEAGVVVASTTNLGGSLAVTRGAQIFINGTKDKPVIMTSKADVATWTPLGSHPTGGNPKTGAWREAANEWGNLTIMGRAYIAENAIGSNVPTCNANNVADMEGLTRGISTDRYGGGNDDDDSGSISYLSLRYGGKVIGLNNELNGLSLGGIGRETDLHHVEIMNNVDDGIEIWGGTLNLQYISIWNVGDDSFDVDQGWRGQAQFGLIVQGYSLDAAQGSGVGDNAIETDGAEDSDWQPVTTATIYNFTVIGQPVDGDGLTAWRDNARVQYRNCIFMDCGEQVIRFDNLDGDGANGYGFGGTLSWPATWATAYNAAPPHANDCPPSVYQAQSDGNLADIRDSVFYNNQNAAAYTEAENIGGSGLNIFTASGYDNVKEPGTSPIVSITRGGVVTRGGKLMVPVVGLNPLPNGSGRNSVNFAPDNGFFRSHKYRGAFGPNANLWTGNWTAATAFGFLNSDANYCDEGNGLPGLNGEPLLSGSGVPAGGNTITLQLRKGRANAAATWIGGLGRIDLPFKDGVIVPALTFLLSIPLDGNGNRDLPIPLPASLPVGLKVFGQVAIVDTSNPKSFSFSNAISFRAQ